MSNEDDAAARYIQALRATVTYQVGELVIGAGSSLKDALRLPWRLYRLQRLHRRIARPGGRRVEPNALGTRARRLLLTLDLAEKAAGSPEALRDLLSQSGLDDPGKAQGLLSAATLWAASRPLLSARLARAALDFDDSDAVAAQAAVALYQAGALSEPARLLRRATASASAPALARHARILDEEALLRAGPSIPRPAPALRPAPDAARLLYVSHLSLPHHTSGYATRTHSLLRALQERGVEALCVTRPGYPWDRRDSRAMADAAAEQRIEGVRYRHLKGLSVGETAPSRYAAQAAEALGAVIEDYAPGVVVAGSNHVNALPALLAARAAGLPFYYDIRGLWEFTSASKLQGWERTERFHLSRQIETRIACEATGVFAISSPVREELIDRGVCAARIALAPNGVEAARFAPGAACADLRETLGLPPERFVFGFIGSLEAYEGVPDLIAAFARLCKAGRDVHLALVGDGAVARQAGELVAAHGLVERASLVGRRPFEEIPAYYRLIDAFAYPRIDSRLTRLVPPLKPLEAMAAGKPVIVSDLPALVELAGGRDNALFATPGDVDSLARAMETLLRDAPLRARLSAAGRAHAAARSWRASIAPLERSLLAEAGRNSRANRK